jgi:GT2 family glycosyltransferase
MPDFKLSITICSWNTQSDLRACLQSLRDCRNEAEFEVIVVDNASRDGSPDMVEREFPEVRLLRQSTNLGFTGGHNLALKERAHPHAALLNSDTVVHPGAIAELVRHMEANPDHGVVGPKLLNPDGSLQYSCRRFPNPVAAAFRSTWLGRIFPNHPSLRAYLMRDFTHDRPAEVDWLSGAAMFLRGELLDIIEGLDPAYFMYCEDEDLCWRAWEAGFKVVYQPAAVVTHAIGRSTDQAANKMIIRHHRSMYRFYTHRMLRRKPLILRPPLALAALLGLSLRAGTAIAKNGFDSLRRSVQR